MSPPRRRSAGDPPVDRRIGMQRARLPLAVAGAAVALGALVFALVLWRQPDPVPSPAASGAARGAGGGLALPVPGVAATTDALRLPDAQMDAAPARIEAPPPVGARVEVPAPAQAAGPVALPDVATGQGFVAPEPVDMPPPRYPPEALRRGERGEVVVRVDVDTDGRAARVDIVRASGSRALDRAALEAARRWRFRPAQRDGVAVAGSVDVPVAFDR